MYFITFLALFNNIYIFNELLKNLFNFFHKLISYHKYDIFNWVFYSKSINLSWIHIFYWSLSLCMEQVTFKCNGDVRGLDRLGQLAAIEGWIPEGTDQYPALTAAFPPWNRRGSRVDCAADWVRFMRTKEDTLARCANTQAGAWKWTCGERARGARQSLTWLQAAVEVIDDHDETSQTQGEERAGHPRSPHSESPLNRRLHPLRSIDPGPGPDHDHPGSWRSPGGRPTRPAVF